MYNKLNSNEHYLIDGHVHADETLVGHLVRALLAEAKGWINVL